MTPPSAAGMPAHSPDPTSSSPESTPPSPADRCRYAVVVPTVGRPSLTALLDSLAGQAGPLPERVVVVDDRTDADRRPPLSPRVGVVPTVVAAGLGRGPAAARNLGWRLTASPWVVFLDDDVALPDGWAAALAADLAAAGEHDAGVQGRLEVPLPARRRPTDWERSTAGLEEAVWATADMAYRRVALAEVSGFDERFRRAYREDADLALRVREAGWRLRRGTRTARHPVRPAPRSVSVRVQRGNADDALMRRLHGPRWRQHAETGRGRLPWHLATTVAGVVALAAPFVARRGVLPDRLGAIRAVGAVAAATWAGLTADFARRRIAPGPRDTAELTTMAWTSAVIPPLAGWHRARGWWRHRTAGSWPTLVRAVLFDRDGTLVDDVPYNGDPDLVRAVPGAGAAVADARRHGLRIGVVSNQSGVARGILTTDQVDAVNRRVDAELGPFDTWQVCPHGPADGCACRKPAPGMVEAAAHRLGVRPEECVVVGDIGADVLAARAAGARAVLVPTPVTRTTEVAAAPFVADDIRDAVSLVLGWSRG
ncbi:MAG: HAD-IIIA family hydrolase [Phycicoccus sp.]